MIEIIAISRLVPHPRNPNQMSAEYHAKLRRNMQEAGHYPALIVRSLRASAEYGPGTDYFEQVGPDALQILDGENRWKVLRSMGAPTVIVDNWGAVDDTHAVRLLTTLNRLRGRDDTKKRATLLSLLSQGMEASVIAEYLPETTAEVQKRIERLATAAEVDVEEVAETIEPFTVMVDDKLARTLNAAIRLRRSKGNLPGRQLDPKEYMTIISAYEKARALVGICEDYILRETK